MAERFRGEGKVNELISRGVKIPNPQSLDIGDEVDIDNIAAEGVVIYPGCRIYGAATVIGPGSELGYEGPATVDDCQLGSGVKLKGGFFSKAVFLDKSNMGLGAHVREGCLLEEEAGGAHCVGLKQTILFPFVTLGSLINFCDCLMAGGTSRKDHSEVGSSYIHFNFTPDQDKATASLIGDVPRGVMLDQPPIFLGGQGGLVGPVRLGYGTVIAAGTIYRRDCLEDNQLLADGLSRSIKKGFTARTYPGFARIVINNIHYLANLLALEQWYLMVRKPFFKKPLEQKLFTGALEKLAVAQKERLKRLGVLADKMTEAIDRAGDAPDSLAAMQKNQLADNFDKLKQLFASDPAAAVAGDIRDDFLKQLAGSGDAGYIETIQNLPQQARTTGTKWLAAIEDEVCDRALALLPSFSK